jgi:hypothetical protein
MTIGMLGAMGIGTVLCLGYFMSNFIAPPNPDVAAPATLWSVIKVGWPWLMLGGAVAATGAFLYWLGGTATHDRQ